MSKPHPYMLSIDGTDFAGKKTLAHEIAGYVKEHLGLNTEIISFPAYDLPTGKGVLSFLNGEIPFEGKTIGDRIAYMRMIAQIFHVNRMEYFLKNDLDDLSTVYIFDRYILSNAIHQIAEFVGDYMKLLHNDESDLETVRDTGYLLGLDHYSDILRMELENKILPQMDLYIVLHASESYLDSLEKAMRDGSLKRPPKHDGSDVLENMDSIRRANEAIGYVVKSQDMKVFYNRGDVLVSNNNSDHKEIMMSIHKGIEAIGVLG